MTYTGSKSIDNAFARHDCIAWLGEGGTLNAQNPFDLRAGRALPVYDIPHVLQQLRLQTADRRRGHLDRQMHPVLSAIIGGWQVNGIVRMDNGTIGGPRELQLARKPYF